MNCKLSALLALVALASAVRPAHAQLSVTFQQGLDGYSGTVDTEFRAADPVTPFGDKQFLSIDAFDGGFQTQAALRFDNLFGPGANQVPANVTIAFATLTVRVSSSSAPDATIGFHRVLPASPWDNNSTWFSLGGDLVPDPVTGELDGYPILANNVEALAIPDAVVPDPGFSGGLLDIDVTNSVAAWYAGAPNLGWAIINDSSNGWDFYSAEFPEEALRPKLTIGYLLALGDFDFNGVVDLLDYQILLDNMGAHIDGPIAQGAPGDINFDRLVDLNDFEIFKNIFPGGPAGLERALADVPEPAAATLALVRLVLASRRRRAA